jgi:hypothetical protein
MWDLWWTTSHCGRFSRSTCAPNSSLIIWGWYNRPNGGRCNKWPRLTQPQEITLTNPRLNPKIPGKKPASNCLRYNRAYDFIFPALSRRYQLIMDVLSEVSERKYVPGIILILLTCAFLMCTRYYSWKGRCCIAHQYVVHVCATQACLRSTHKHSPHPTLIAQQQGMTTWILNTGHTHSRMANRRIIYQSMLSKWNSLYVLRSPQEFVPRFYSFSKVSESKNSHGSFVHSVILLNGRIFHLRFIILIFLRANMSTVLPHVWSVLVVLWNGRTSNGPDRAGQTAFVPPQSCVDFRHSRNFWIDTFGWMLYE